MESKSDMGTTIKIPQHKTPRGTWCRMSGVDSASGICRLCEPEPTRPESTLCCTLYDIQCICSFTNERCRCRCRGCTCGPLAIRTRTQED
jgi:hypothetical protein